MSQQPTACSFGRFLRPCRQPVSGTCRYCGRPFCTSHGHFLEEGLEVCRRNLCQEKLSDLRRHQVYRQLVEGRNAEQSCGLPACTNSLWGQCSHCQGLFCRSHLHPRLRSVRMERAVVQEPVSLCDHCWERHQLWQRK